MHPRPGGAEDAPFEPKVTSRNLTRIPSSWIQTADLAFFGSPRLWLPEPSLPQQRARLHVERVGKRDERRDRHVLAAALDLSKVNGAELGRFRKSFLSEATPRAPTPHVRGD